MKKLFFLLTAMISLACSAQTKQSGAQVKGDSVVPKSIKVDANHLSPGVDTAAIPVLSGRDLAEFLYKEIGHALTDQKGQNVGWQKGDLMKAISATPGISNDEYEKIDQIVAELMGRLVGAYQQKLNKQLGSPGDKPKK